MVNTNTDSLLRAANARLKAGKIGVSLESRNGYLYIRGTFPPKPGSDRASPYQQRQALKVPVSPEAIKEAELQCNLIGLDLQLGRFSWEAFLGITEDRESVGYWIGQWQDYYWATRQRTASTTTTWSNYEYWLKRLDSNAPLSVEYLKMAIVTQTKPDSSMRMSMSGTLSRFARFAGLDDKEIKALKGSYGVKSPNLKELPTDAEIEATWQQLADAGSPWRWLFGIVAAYGVRPHEVFYLDNDYSRFPELRVSPGGKTGGRVLLPLLKHWPELWELDQPIMPPRMKLDGVGDRNKRLSPKLAAGFQRQGLRNPYSYRHAWAVRAKMQGLDVDTSSHYLGHSPDVHRSVYLRNAGEEPYRAAWERLS